jgi:2-desacetyl-2-hydroxyethyl bacteriochlorophyllide A dehydrogenase
MSLRRAALVEPLAVACHDVRLGEVQTGDFVVVLGGGPIGTLVGLVAQNEGAEVVVSEINPDRIRIGRELGLDVVDPTEVDLRALVEERTGGAGADVLFEVTASAAGAATMTQLMRTRGRIVIVGIFGEPPKVDLKAILWREMRLRGARVYERQDFQKAIALAAEDVLPLDALITEVYPLERLEAALVQLESGGPAMKILIDVAAEGAG